MRCALRLVCVPRFLVARGRRSMRSIKKKLAASATLAIAFVAGTAAMLTAQPWSAQAKENGLIGLWRCNGPDAGPRPEVIGMLPDGHLVIDAAGHIIVGTYRVEFPQVWQPTVVITVEDSDLRIGAPISLSAKINNGYTVMGIGLEGDQPFALNRLCHRMGARR
jgi:hypothetical protein